MTESKTQKFSGSGSCGDIRTTQAVVRSSFRNEGKRSLSARSIFVFDDVEAALLVGHPQQTAVVFEHVVGQWRRYAISRFRNEVALLFGIRRIVDIDDAQPPANQVT